MTTMNHWESCGRCHQQTCSCATNQEPKMRDRFGAPLHIGDRVIHLTARGSTPHTDIGTIESWGSWAGEPQAKVMLDSGRSIDARFEKRLIRWCP